MVIFHSCPMIPRSFAPKHPGGVLPSERCTEMKLSLFRSFMISLPSLDPRGENQGPTISFWDSGDSDIYGTSP